MASICADARPLIESFAARATIRGGVAGNGTDDNKRAGPALGSGGTVFAGVVPGLVDSDGAIRAAVAAAGEPEPEAPCAADIMRGGVPGGFRHRRPQRTRFTPQIRQHFLERRQPLRVHQFQKAQFEMQSRIGFAPQVVIGH